MQQAQPTIVRDTPTAAPASSRQLFGELNRGQPDAAGRADARRYLQRQLALARELPADLPAPDQPALLEQWILQRSEAVGEQYHAYLAGRRAGAPRHYFTTKAHALYFLQAAAPTKLVDGSWLYGLLARWDDPDFRPLVQTYLEELGDGVPEKNHVVLYKKLLAAHGCDQWQDLDDSYFIQGAIQLALGYDAEHYLPEIIGYNLGYEQLPLHLLITAYELNELGIDPYYFTLHITVDNGGTGHAHKAVQALQQLLPRCGDAAAFHRRVLDGYRLNDLGAGTTAIIAGFDAQAELVRILAAKSVVGKNMHSDYCRVGGRPINDWLSDPAQIPAMLTALEAAGWIQRGQDPERSRFWKLIQSERAEMFGVFSAYEQQVLADWIASPGSAGIAAGASTDDALEAGAGEPAASPRRTLSHRARQRALEALGAAPGTQRPHGIRGVIRHHALADDAPDGFGAELRLLERQVASAGGKPAAMELLRGLMSPAGHHGAVGLMATRMFCQLLA